MDRDPTLKEIREAEADLIEAKDSLERDRFKWATIQGYYSTFHATRALIYNRGLGEKSHYALLVALGNLLIKDLGIKLIEDFEGAMSLRGGRLWTNFLRSWGQGTIEAAEIFHKKAK
ncbi:MAG: HEPN domain-containing protein [Candidatus Bathyarchaeia archaeon]